MASGSSRSTAAFMALVLGCSAPGWAISVGAIRWDAWNGRSGDIIASTVAQTMRPPQYHWRLPWYVVPDPASGNLSFDADQPSVMDAELRLAAYAGIGFWAYDTYCVWPQDQAIRQCQGWWGRDGGHGPDSVGYRATDPAYGLKRHLASPHRGLVNISLVLLGASPATEPMRRRYLPLLREPNFQTVLGGRPLLFLFGQNDDGSDDAAMNGGWAGWRAQWDAFRNESIQQGTGNPYLVAMCVGTANLHRAINIKQRLGFDAVSAYALPGGTLEGVPFSQQVAQATAFWAAAKEAGQPLVPVVPTGWDPRPRADHPPVWVNESGQHFIAPTAKELTDLFGNATAFMHAEPETAQAGVAIAYGVPSEGSGSCLTKCGAAWNENTEGGWLLPTLGEGRTRVEAVRKALNPH